MSFEERGLFRERIRHLDKKIHPGLSKLTWISLGISVYFVADCRLNASRIQLIVDGYKGANIEIGAQCVKISELLLIKIDSKRVYADMDFDTYQVSIYIKVLRYCFSSRLSLNRFYISCNPYCSIWNKTLPLYHLVFLNVIFFFSKINSPFE